jgi:hypothetical protein
LISISISREPSPEVLNGHTFAAFFTCIVSTSLIWEYNHLLIVGDVGEEEKGSGP